MRPRELQDRCERLRSALIGNRFATAAEFEPFWPEPPEWGIRISPQAYLNRHPTGPHAARAAQLVEWDAEYEWTVCLTKTAIMFGERNALLRPTSEHAREKVMAGMLAQPKDVLLASGETATVYPKSYDCLRMFSTRGWAIELLKVRRDALVSATETDEVNRDVVPEPVAAIEAVQHALSDQEALLCWVATSPGPYLPWVEGDRAPDGDPWVPTEPTPRRFYELNVLDVLFIREAFQEVNFLPLHYLPRVSGKKGHSEWDGFQSWFAQRSRRRGVPAKYLMLFEPFVSQVVEDTLSAASLEEVLGK